MTDPIALPDGTRDHLLTEAERQQFETQGYLAIPAALDAATVARFTALAEHADAEFHAPAESSRAGTSRYAHLNQHDLLGRAPEYLDLIDWPTTFPKVFGVLGWNIQLFHTQLVVTPPGHPDAPVGGYAFHQDNNRMNLDFEGDVVHPRVSVKVAYFLTDLPDAGMGNFCVVPGSHRVESSETADATETTDAIEITARAGDALLFDRRLWHSASSNHSNTTRIVVFYGYSYRWLRPKSAMDLPHLVEQCDPIRRQLLGAATGANGYFDPTDEDVPLRSWIADHLGAPAVAP